MEYFQKKPSAPGVRPSRETHRLTSHAAIVVGNIYAVDGATATSANSFFATTSKTSPDGAVEGTIWVVALEAASAAGQDVLFGLRGVFPCLAGAGGYAADIALGVASGALLAAATGDVVVAKSIGTSAVSAASIVEHWFDGRGMGTAHAI